MNSATIKRWMEKANRSLFFVLALLFHLILAFMIATFVIFQAPVPPKEDFKEVFVPPAAPPPPPPQTSPQTVSVSPTAVPTTSAAITTTSSAASFTVPMPQIDATISPTMQQQAVKSLPTAANALAGRMGAIRGTVGSWRSADNIRNAGGDVHNLVAKFPVYLAQYGTGGDWRCNNYFNNGETPETPTSGSLPDLVDKIEEWSQKNLQADTIKTIRVDSPDLISHPPPYIFFTGHADFHLSEGEITNLQKYLQAGGAIWGDSAFAGDGSRFDVAFHREMKRVLPDPDIVFQDLPMDHPIFTKSWFPIDQVPKGMNYRRDPVQIVNLDGKLAIIYTPNDYGDLMTLPLKPGRDVSDAQALGTDHYTPKTPLYTPSGFGRHAATFYRNYAPGPSMAVYQLSMNILAHLLIRFDDQLLLTP